MKHRKPNSIIGLRHKKSSKKIKRTLLLMADSLMIIFLIANLIIFGPLLKSESKYSLDLFLKEKEQKEKEVLVLQTCYPPGTTRKVLLVFASPEQEKLNLSL